MGGNRRTRGKPTGKTSKTLHRNVAWFGKELNQGHSCCEATALIAGHRDARLKGGKVGLGRVGGFLKDEDIEMRKVWLFIVS